MTHEAPLVEIGDQLKKFFSSLDSKWIRVSFLLSKLDLTSVADLVDQRESTYSAISMLKLLLLKQIKNVRSYSKMTKSLDRETLLELGFEQLPTKQGLNYFIRTKLNNQTKNILDSIVEKVFREAERHQCVLDIPEVERTVKEHKNKSLEERKISTEACRFFKKLMRAHLPIPIGKNSRFTLANLYDTIIYLADNQYFANGGCHRLQELLEKKNQEVPSGQMLLYFLHKLDTEEILTSFNNFRKALFTFAKRNYKVLNRTRLDIAYDTHLIPFYGNKNAAYVKGGKHQRGTSYFYQFLTASVVVAGQRFSLDEIPIHQLDEEGELLDKSLGRVKKMIKINRVYLDRWFANSTYIPVLNKHKTNYLMPIELNPKIKAWMNKSEACKARKIEDFEIGQGKNKVETNLFLVDDEEGLKRAFCTNMDLPEQLAHYCYTWYSKRWGIETSYRLKARSFRAKTTSTEFKLRLLYFLFSALLENLWVLCNICIGVQIYGKIPETPIIDTERFMAFLGKSKDEYIDPGGTNLIASQ